jgi:hypothetical protein
MKEGQIESKALVVKMMANISVVEDVPGFLTKLGGFAAYLNNPKSYAPYLQAIDLCETLAKSPEKEEEIRGQISSLLAQWAEEMSKHACDPTLQSELMKHATSDNKAIEAMVKSFYIAMLGNQTLGVHIPKSAEGMGSISAMLHPAAAHQITSTGLAALDQSTAQKVCETVISIAKQARESGETNKGGVKELVAEIKKRKDTIVAMTGAGIDLAGKEAGAGEKARKAIVFINKMLMSAPKLPVHAINKALPRNLSSALDYVAASLGGAVEKPEATPAA